MLYFAIPSLALMLFYAGYLLRMAWFFSKIKVPEPKNQDSLPKVTVVVPARNEVECIGDCVAAILDQDYPRDLLELIVVNDHSEDGTSETAVNASHGDPRFRLMDLAGQQGVAYKKAAVSMAVSQAKGDWILTTDADCVMGKSWVSSMSRSFNQGVDMVSGPVRLSGKGWFQEFQALEFMGLIAVGAGAIQSGRPTMCNGANLAYRKSAFDEVGGFSGIDQIASGDDELLMHKMVERGRGIAFSKDTQSVVTTPAHSTWRGFKEQRIRWVSKSRQYDRSSITLTLMLSYLAMACIPLMVLVSIWEPKGWWVLALQFVLKMAAEACVLVQAARFFGKLGLLIWLPLEQAAHVAYVLWVGIAGNKKAYTWKGRTVK